MTFDHALAILMFALVTSVTPGPNNIMLMASGINYGVRRSLPHASGILFGWPTMVLLLGLGLGQLFATLPWMLTVLKIGSTLYMLWLAWKIAGAQPFDADPDSGASPFGFVQAALFQWVNGKAWIMAVSALSAFTLTQDYMASLLVIVAAFFVSSIFSSTLWTLFGAGLRHVLSDPRWFRAINIGLALSLVISLWPMLAH